MDLLVEYNGKLYPMEAKATASVLPQHAAALRKWRELAGSPEPAVIAANIPTPVNVAPGVRAVPWWWI